MTFRDTSADITLDANMNNWYESEITRLKSEIDALKMELIELRSELVKSGMERLALMDEVANLKENAKVYKWADAAMKDFSTTTKEEREESGDT